MTPIRVLPLGGLGPAFLLGPDVPGRFHAFGQAGGRVDGLARVLIAVTLAVGRGGEGERDVGAVVGDQDGRVDAELFGGPAADLLQAHPVLGGDDLGAVRLVHQVVQLGRHRLGPGPQGGQLLGAPGGGLLGRGAQRRGLCLDMGQ